MVEEEVKTRANRGPMWKRHMNADLEMVESVSGRIHRKALGELDGSTLKIGDCGKITADNTLKYESSMLDLFPILKRGRAKNTSD